MPRLPGANDWKSPVRDGLCPTEVDWAMMAAYIDGEGSVLINPRNNRKDYSAPAAGFYLKVTVANTDVRLLAWIKTRFGGSYKDANTAQYYKDRNCKTAWHWSASSGHAAWILWNCLRFFVIKAEQAEIGIALQESMGKYSGAGRRQSLPTEVVEERRALKKRLLIMKARGRVINPDQQERIERVS